MYPTCYKQKQPQKTSATVKRFDNQRALVYFVLLCAVLWNAGETVVEEYCTGETFRPRCIGGKSDVIVMIAARYGRMRFGRCVEEEPELAAIKDNPRFIGCSEDVKHILDQHCSGLPECDFRIRTQNFDGVKPCIAGLQMYMEASFVCVKGQLLVMCIC